MKALRSVGLSLVVIALVLLGAGMIVLRASGLGAYSVQTDSMSPAIERKDLVLVEKVVPSVLVEGEVIAFRSIVNPDEIITHRLLGIDTASNTLVTKGDALNDVDMPIPSQQLVGRVKYTFPLVGGLFDMLHKPGGLVAVIYIPAFVVLVAELRRLRSYYASQHYVLRSQ